MTLWAICQSYKLKPVCIVSETEKTVTYLDGTSSRRSQKISTIATGICGSSGVLPWRGSEDEAQAMVEKLTSIDAERRRREGAAREYMRRECARLLELSECQAKN